MFCPIINSQLSTMMIPRVAVSQLLALFFVNLVVKSTITMKVSLPSSSSVAATAATTTKALITSRFVLMETHHAGNVGAAARAIKTMGFDDLVLVSPRDPKVLNRQRTKEGASGAIDVLQGARIYETLEQAVCGTDIWCATGMPNDMYRERTTRRYYSPRSYFDQLLLSQNNNKLIIHDDDDTENSIDQNDTKSTAVVEQAQSQEKLRLSFIFGNERLGMRDDDLDLCHVILGIPTNPKFGSLNLASAVQLIAYDWRQAIGGFDEHGSL